MRTINEIIVAAGGARAIESASGGSVKRDAVYKWPGIGIPDRHWELIIPLAETSPAELYAANLAARRCDPVHGESPEAAA